MRVGGNRMSVQIAALAVNAAKLVEQILVAEHLPVRIFGLTARNLVADQSECGADAAEVVSQRHAVGKIGAPVHQWTRQIAFLFKQLGNLGQITQSTLLICA